MHTLGKNERLRSRKLIGQLFHDGRSFASGPLKGLYIMHNDCPDPLRCGFTVSSRTFKKAVHRNRIKRLMRETYRVQKHELQQTLLQNNMAISLFIIFRGNEMPEFDVISKHMAEVINKLLKLVNENVPQVS